MSDKCKFCNVQIKNRKNIKGEGIDEIWSVDDPNLLTVTDYVYCQTFTSNSLEINYCPICGRDLKGV